MDSGMFSSFLEGEEADLGLKPELAVLHTTILCGLKAGFLNALNRVAELDGHGE